MMAITAATAFGPTTAATIKLDGRSLLHPHPQNDDNKNLVANKQLLNQHSFTHHHHHAVVHNTNNNTNNINNNLLSSMTATSAVGRIVPVKTGARPTNLHIITQQDDDDNVMATQRLHDNSFVRLNRRDTTALFDDVSADNVDRVAWGGGVEGDRILYDADRAEAEADGADEEKDMNNR